MKFLSKLKNVVKKEQFNPSVFGLLVNPFYFVRKGLYEQFRYFSKNIFGKILDVGCGTKPYQDLFNGTSYIGLEMERTKNNALDKFIVFYDGGIFPFVDGEFDVVFTSQVFEHVFNPENFLKEINRVLRPGGKLLMSVPFIWDEHEQPFDYGRYTSFGLKALLQKGDFEIIEEHKSVVGFEVIVQLFALYLYKVFLTKNGHLNFILFTFFISPFIIIGALLGRILPKNNDLYMDNVILAKKM